jgi:hypothetical protein
MPKRTRKESQDINQFATSIVRQSTQDVEPTPDQATISQVMRAMGRRGGLNAAIFT